MMTVMKFLKSRMGMSLVALVVVGLVYYYFFMNGSSHMASVITTQPEPFSPGDVKSAPAEVNAPMDDSSSVAMPSAVPSSSRHDTVQPADLLPPDMNTQWQTDNNLTGMKMPSLTSATFLSGADTIGQSLKNPNLQLRADPVIPRVNTGPWNQPTIDTDAIRVSLDIGRAE
jgi:hypothetical protein